MVSLAQSVAAARDEFQGNGRGWSVVAIALGWAAIVGTMLSVPAALPFVRAEFTLTNAEAGLAVTAMWLVYGACQFPAGLLTDRVGERRMLLGSMALGAVVVAAVSLSGTFPMFAASAALFGVVGGLFATPRVTLLSRQFPDNSGTAIGAVMAVGNAGSSILPAGVGLLAAAATWRAGFGAAVPLFIVALVGVWFVIPAREPTEPDEDTTPLGELLPRVLAAVRDREILLVTAAVTLTFFTFQGMTAFLTTYLVDEKAIGEGTAALLYGGLFAVAAVTQPVAGRIADRTNERIVLVAITAAYAVLLAALVMSGQRLLLGAVVVLLGTQRGATPVATAYLAAALPEDIRGGGYGLLRTVFTTVSSSAAVAIGVFADADLFDAAFLLLAVMAVVATGCYLLLPSPSAEL
ncbi:MFS transporter [Halolamina litorea]|uniref:MFS transporter n=1 Tax=Halolamina litorea TaxID=1515593 RepID=A0ABD6BQD1_9EURY|nr:MFS transporter [Halolamina litorea]